MIFHLEALAISLFIYLIGLDAPRVGLVGLLRVRGGMEESDLGLRLVVAFLLSSSF